jgi:hypothetical protein
MKTSAVPKAVGAGSEQAPDAGAPGYVADSWTIVLGLFALGNLANGLWMLVDPAHWYENLPAGVPDFGPLNQHFVRDIGCTFVLLGLALGVGAFVPRWRVAACAAAAAFSVLHALVHVLDTLRGLVGPEHWRIDLGGVYVPAAVLTALTWVLARRGR